MKNLSLEIASRCDTPASPGEAGLANWQNRKATDEMDDTDLLLSVDEGDGQFTRAFTERRAILRYSRLQCS